MTLLSKLNFILTKENVPKIIIFFVFLLLTVTFEMLGIALVIPAVAFIIESDFNTNSKLLNDFLFFLVEHFDRILLIKIVLLSILITFFLKNLFLFLFLWWQKSFLEHLYKNICQRLIKGQLFKSYLDYVKTSSALTARDFNEVKVFIKYIESFIILIVEFIILTLIICLLLAIEYKVTLIVASIIISLSLIFRYITKKLIKNYGEERFFRSGQMMKTVLLILENYKNIKAFNVDDYFINKFKSNNSKYSNVNKKFQIIDNSPRYWLEFIGVSGICFFIFFLLKFEYPTNSIIPIIGLFAVAFYRIIPSILRIMRSAQSLNYTDPVMDTLFLNLQKFEKIKIQKKNGEIKFENQLCLENISFYYPDKSLEIFEELNLIIKKGEKVGIMGKTGLGKSTLIDILMGLIIPDTGKILVDKTDIHSNIEYWRSLIGLVPQQINVLNGTIKENIIFGRDNDLDENLINKKISNAILLSEFDEVIKLSENGLNSIVGDKGLNLSGGQLQRLAFARALYNNPELLILDEATNALDPKTESKIINNLFNLSNNPTIIIISHNIETIQFCNTKYELKNLSLNKINV